MENSHVISPTPQHAILIAALEESAPQMRAKLTKDKIVWLYAFLSVLERHEHITREEPLRIQLQRKILLRLATEDTW